MGERFFLGLIVIGTVGLIYTLWKRDRPQISPMESQSVFKPRPTISKETQMLIEALKESDTNPMLQKWSRASRR